MIGVISGVEAFTVLLTDWREVPFLPSPLNKPLSSCFFFFNENSAEEMSSLRAIEQFLHLPEVKLKKPADAHWLSHDTACHTRVKISSSEIRD